ncbi:MAG: SWIM zinc finger domain-containing protein [Actinomycetota bacterium]|nr:SWIM zinc finger domain-containing protein [Actinomycetota bacterium]
MDTKSVPAPPPTRDLRGLKLFRDHGGEIIHEGHGVYTVPGCSGGVHEVDLAVFGGEESCSCPDYQRHKEPCKHLYAATIYRSKARTRAREEQAARTKARASRASLAPLAAAL